MLVLNHRLVSCSQSVSQSGQAWDEIQLFNTGLLSLSYSQERRGEERLLGGILIWCFHLVIPSSQQRADVNRRYYNCSYFGRTNKTLHWLQTLPKPQAGPVYHYSLAWWKYFRDYSRRMRIVIQTFWQENWERRKKSRSRDNLYFLYIIICTLTH